LNKVHKISGIITTLNEAQHIVACITSLQLICNEVIVIDSGSTDNTCELARSAGATVYHQSYLGDGFQKNVALQYVQNAWVFSLDADERIMPELATAVNALDLENSCYAGYAIRRRNHIGKRWVKCCNWYPDYLVRLYRHDTLRFHEMKQHAFVPVENTKKLKADILHFRYKNYGELFVKPERNYSTRGAKVLYLQGKRANIFTPVRHGLGAFLINYLFRGGLFGGIDGLTLSLAIAQNSYLKYAKLLEYQRDKSVRDAEDFNSVW
jgi:glycosyltransferase involved in cell wall biosynthesis